MTVSVMPDNRDGIASRLRRLVVSLLVLLVMLGISGAAAVEVATGAVGQLTQGYNPADTAHQKTLTLMLDAETAVRGYLLTGNRTFLQPYTNARSQILPTLAQTRSALDRIGVRRWDGPLATERSLAEQWLTGYADPIATAAGRMALPSIPRQQAAKTLFDRFRATDGSVSTQLAAKRVQLRGQAGRLHSLAIPLLGVATLLAVSVASLLAYRAATGISRPLRAVRAVIARFDRGDLTAHANEQAGPSEVRALARAVNALGRRARTDAVADRDAEQFRQRARLISSAIRRSSNGTQMAELLVRGLGDAFEVDRVWLCTFADAPVPELVRQWQREPLQPLPGANPVHAESVQALAERLWDAADTIAIDDHRTYEPTNTGRAIFKLARATGSTASLVVPIGDGGVAIGLIWLVMSGAPRHWTLTETGMAQFLAADLAHSLNQAAVIESQARAVRALRELDQAKADFISTMSHELRTPLTTITGYLEMLRDGDGDAGPLPAAAEPMLDALDRNAVRLRTLIEDVLTQSRIDAGRLRLEVSSVDPAELLVSVVESLRPMATVNGVQLELLALTGLKIEADPLQLEQVFTNLISNACKFTPAGGRVTVELAEDADASGEGLAVLVSDTGIGVPPAEAGKLFTRFFRASNATAAALPGTGLGLAIVREIVHRHGGSVDFDSELGAGSTFTVWLPARPPAALA